MPRSVLRGRSFFWEKLIFTELISVSDRQFFGPPETKFGPALKSAHYASRYFLSKNNFFHKTHFVIFFRTLTRIFPMKFWRKFRRCRQNSKLRVRKLFVELHSFRGNFFSFCFRPLDKKSIFEKKSARLKAFTLHAQKNFSGRKSFSLIRSFFHKCFSTLVDKFSKFSQTFVQQAVKLALHLSRRFWWRETNSLRKKRWLYNSLLLFGPFAKRFDRALTTAYYVLGGISWSKTYC